MGSRALTINAKRKKKYAFLFTKSVKENAGGTATKLACSLLFYNFFGERGLFYCSRKGLGKLNTMRSLQDKK